MLDHSYTQIEELSWWPKTTTWETSPMDVGYWTDYAENWFSQRLSQYRVGEGTLKNAREWRDNLRQASVSGKTHQMLELASENFLYDRYQVQQYQ